MKIQLRPSSRKSSSASSPTSSRIVFTSPCEISNQTIVVKKMKFKINKACDLNSISVLPPQIRRLSAGGLGQQHMSQSNRSQQSQQSLSQSQHGIYSQFSQTSIDDFVANDQRLSSQDKDSSARRLSNMGMMNYRPEESQKPFSRPSSDIMHKWNSSNASENRAVNEALEQRIGRMETSVATLGIILDSVQRDVLQVNKGTKEVSQELEGIKQKLNVIDCSLQQLKKGQEDNKASLDGGLKDIYDQLSKDVCHGKLQEILLEVSVLPDRIGTCLLRLQTFIGDTLTKELKALGCSLKTQNENTSQPLLITFPPIDASTLTKFNKKKETPKFTAGMPKVVSLSPLSSEIQVGEWKSVKRERKQNGASVMEQEREWKVTMESDEDIEGGFSYLLKEKETSIMEDNMSDEQARTARILRSARRRKRRMKHTIIIN